jgi:FKBP-type peptidyl-prolyl cis-trans isomerase
LETQTHPVALKIDFVPKGELMKRKWMVVLGVVLLTAQCAKEPSDLKTEKDKVAYSIGVSVARNIKQHDIDVNPDFVVKGLRDGLSGQKLLLSDDEMQAIKTAFQKDQQLKQMEARKKAMLENKKEGETFLAENKKKEDVVTLPSGLQYKILKAGEGKKPRLEDAVEVRYRGTLINGKEFNSSGTGTKTFKVAWVIPGWREALQLMPVGSKWQLVVPPELAYGERGMGLAIMPNSTLVFEMELVGVKPAEAKAPEAVKPPEAKTPKKP